eukprot:1960380-Pleurochrysis_carterae.AAC.1
MSACRVSTAPAPFSRDPTLSEIGGSACLPPAPALSVAPPSGRSRGALPGRSLARSPPRLSAGWAGFTPGSFPPSGAAFVGSAGDHRVLRPFAPRAAAPA